MRREAFNEMVAEKDAALELAATALASAIHAAWDMALTRYGSEKGYFADMSEATVGRMVLEISTYYSIEMGKLPNTTFLDSVGVLEEIANERVKIDEWDEEEDGPWPLDVIYYIRTLDGRRYRWSNASFVNCPSSLSKTMQEQIAQREISEAKQRTARHVP